MNYFNCIEILDEIRGENDKLIGFYSKRNEEYGICLKKDKCIIDFIPLKTVNEHFAKAV